MNSRFANLPLHCHAAQPAGISTGHAAPVTGIAVSGSLDAAGLLELEYQLHGNLQQLLLPPGSGVGAHSATRRDQLWRHTCLELFARAADSPGYLEFNFAPNGAWAAYEFDDYRAGQRSAEASHCAVKVQRESDHELQVRVSVLVPAMASTPRVATWQLGLAAVIEGSDGHLSYWALRHPRGPADFHDPAGFSYTLAAPAL